MEEESKAIGYVYLMQCGSQYKIGFSIKPKKRVKQLRTGSPYPVFLVHWIKTEFYHRIEKQLHQEFYKKRGEGEWFALSDKDVAYIKSLNEFGRTPAEQEEADRQWNIREAGIAAARMAKCREEARRVIAAVAAV